MFSVIRSVHRSSLIALEEGSPVAHYDLYSTLGIDRSLDSVSIAAYLDNIQFQGTFTNPGGLEEIRIARAILGDQYRRSMYDSRLYDPHAPEITVDALRDLAGLGNNANPQMMGVPSQPGAPFGSAVRERADWASGAVKRNFYSAHQRLNPMVSKATMEVARSSKKVMAFTVLATLLVVAIFAGLVSGVKYFISDERKVTNLVEEFLKLETSVATEEWLNDHADPSTRNMLVEELDLSGDFEGIDDYFAAENPKISGVSSVYEMFGVENLSKEERDDVLPDIAEIDSTSAKSFKDVYQVYLYDNGTLLGAVYVGIKSGDPVLLTVF